MSGAVLNKKSRNKWIAELWEAGPPRSMTALSREAIAAGVFDDDRDLALAKYARLECHSVIRKDKDGEGLPQSGPTGGLDDDGDGVWAQRTFWEVSEYEFNVAAHVKLGVGALTTATKLADECERRHGQRPAVPSI